jgi:FG-GAP-like repeat/Thrombospondin type 3 repeat
VSPRRLALLAAFALALGVPQTADAAILGFTEEAPSPYVVGTDPYTLTSADFNGDGRPDLAAFNGTSSNASILLRQPVGGFAAEAGSPLTAASGPSGGVAADFDADGDKDLAVSGFSGGGAVTVHLRQPGGFAASTSLTPGAPATGIAAADFNADGKQDLAVAKSDGSVRIFNRNNPNTGFVSEGDYTAGTFPRAIAVADFDGNGRPDLAVLNRDSGTISIKLRASQITFNSEATVSIGATATPQAIVAADFNGDGRPDLATSNSGTSAVSVFLRKADNTGFAPEPGSPIAVSSPLGLGAGDFDGDGRIDLAVSDQAVDTVTILKRRTTNDGFDKALTPATFDAPNGLTVSDVDSDGKPDVIVSSDAVDKVQVLRNTSQPDADGDGVPDASDNCPSIPNPDQTDEDGNGIGAACESDDGKKGGFIIPPLIDPSNASPPSISGPSSTGVYTCNPGSWRNLQGGFSYRWFVSRLFGPAVVVSTAQTYKPVALDIGGPAYCDVTTPGTFSATVANSPQIFFSLPGPQPPGPYGDVRVRGIDMAQVVQPNAGATKSVAGGLGTIPAYCGSGVPTSFQNPPLCSLSGRQQQSVPYAGVTLDSDKPTTAIVYVDIKGQSAGDPKLFYDLEVSGSNAANGRVLGPPIVTQIQDPPRSSTDTVTQAQRADPAYGVRVKLPSSWTAAGRINLVARINFPTTGQGTAAFGTRQCAGDCSANDVFTLRNVAFTRFPQLLVTPVQLQKKTGSATQGALPTPFKVTTTARAILPGGERWRMGGYATTLDIGGVTAKVPTKIAGTNLFRCDAHTGANAGDVARDCRLDFVEGVLRKWITANPGRTSVNVTKKTSTERYDVVLGVHDYAFPSPTPANPNRLIVEPGWCCPTTDIRNDAVITPRTTATTPYLTVTANASTPRPYTAVTHEFGHFLTAAHAGTAPACGTGASSESWPPDQTGRLQSTKFTPFNPLVKPTVRSEVEGTWGASGLIPIDHPLFDLMSYCSNLSDSDGAPGNTWLSAFSWNQFATQLTALGTRVGLGDRPKPAGSARAVARGAGGSGRAFAVGAAGPDSGVITQVVAADGDDGVPEDDPSSPYRLQSLDAGGAVILDVGVTVAANRESTSPDGAGTFVGAVAPNAATVVLLRDGVELARLARSKPPTVKLTAPKAGAALRKGAALDVRWTTSDPDPGSTLNATVDFSPDGGRTWRGVYDGPSTGKATVPGDFLSSTTSGRVRVVVSDGFAQATGTSGTFAAAGAPPRVQIVTPQAGIVVRSTDRVALLGSGTDDGGRALTGSSLTWFAGPQRLGTGARLTKALPAGTKVVRLVAKDRTGRTAAATVKVSVQTPALRLAAVKVPVKVARTAKTMTVTLTASASSTLTTAGKRTTIRTKATKVTVKLPSKPAVGVLKVPFTLTSRSKGAKGTVKGTFSVLRT